MVETVKGYQLQPDILGALSGGLKFGKQLTDVYKQRQIQNLLAGQPTEQQRMLAEQEGEITGMAPQEDLIQQARRIDPFMAEKTLQAMGMDDATKRAEASRFAARVETLPMELQDQAILERADMLRSQGRNPKDTLELLDMNPQQRAQALRGVQLMDLATKERLALQQQQQKIAAAGLGGPEVKSSKILDDGTTVQSMKDGTTQVISPSGEALSGDARTKAIRDAQSYGVELQGKRAQQREGGKGAAKIALDAFDQFGKIQNNITDLQEGIRLVREEGAETGPVADKLPSFRASTKKLENLRARLGLNVVGAVTFGALSEGELNLALDVALPKGLNEAQIVDWMEKRVKAQQKLANNLEEAALFLSEPGNTVADFIRYTKKRDKERAAAQPATQPTTAPAATQPATQPQKVGRFTVKVKE